MRNSFVTFSEDDMILGKVNETRGGGGSCARDWEWERGEGRRG
jgi:hypothetical protein